VFISMNTRRGLILTVDLTQCLLLFYSLSLSLISVWQFSARGGGEKGEV
jgi:hypothetical protein